MNPIFYISSERSGTNFFRNFIHAHSKGYFPHNPSIYEDFKPLEHLYGSKEEFVFDVIGLVKFNHDPWDYIPEEEEVVKRLSKICSLEITKVIYELCAEHYQVSHVGIKNVRFANQIDQIYETYDNPKFIYQYRDARDCAASWLSINSGPKHVYHAAKRWNDEQNDVKAVMDQLNANGDLIQFSYEELVTDAEGMMRKVCSFLGMEFEEQMLEFHKSKAAKKSATMHKAWNNLAKPIMTNNFNKFESKLSPDQIKIIEGVAGPNMVRLGYQLKNVEYEVSAESFAPNLIESYNEINEQLRKENFEKSDRNYRKERKDQYRKSVKNKFI
ncbi:MAG: sulfotransferase [Flavobacteriales bacterium]|nr:sulfotransferase [Flavobacteriales bacterium]